jgi:hypothetical protein
MSGVFLTKGEGLVQMIETPYEAESILQDLVARFPALLAADDSSRAWLLIRQEAGLALGDDGGGRGYLDHLFVDAAGIPTLVEVKRSSDTRIRREVVGQLLDYAANAAPRWGGDTLRRWFEDACAARGDDPDQLLADTFAAVEDVDSYWDQVRTNIAAERLRLVFVADAIPSELRRVVEFLNGQMTQTEVLAIEIKRYVDVDGQHQTLVPRVIGQTEVAKQIKSTGTTRVWTRDEIVTQIETQRGAAEAEVARAIFAWVDKRGDLDEWYGHGKKDGSFQAGYQDPYAYPFALYGYGRVEIHFQYLGRRPPFDDQALRRELRDRLVAIPGVAIPDDMLTKRPSIPLQLLKEPGALERLTSALDWTLTKVKAHHA